MEIPASLRSMLEEHLGRPSEPFSPERYARHRAEAHNSTRGTLEGYDCPLCLNRGSIAYPVERDGKWDVEMSFCKCIKTRAGLRNLEKSGLKGQIDSYTFDSFSASEDWQKKLKAAAQEYAERREGWFFVGGQSGAGKTHICTAICGKLLYAGMPVRYMKWRDEVTKLKAAVNNTEAYTALIEPYKTVKVLYVDDLFKTGNSGGEKASPTSADINIAFELLNARYCQPELMTIISSELTVNEIISLDEATGGRIFERSKCFNIPRDGKRNYRLRGTN